MPIPFAHSVAGLPTEQWELLPQHAAAVSRSAADRAGLFGWSDVARLAGLLHDIGKCSPAFQAYLHRPAADARGPDHSTAGAVEAARLYPGLLGRMLAFVIAGHHAGLADGVRLAERLTKPLEPYAGWRESVGNLPDLPALRPSRPLALGPHRGFTQAFLIRMLFSCLVDADFIETEAFYASVGGRNLARGGFTDMPELHRRLQDFMATKRAGAAATPLNTLRATILDHALGKAELPPGLFTLTVPTGGGKTLASLSFALNHAVTHGLRRVIYVIPFTSIIEQTCDVFRGALAAAPGQPNTADVLEHHATFDWEAAARRDGGGRHEDGRGVDPLDLLRRAAENWAAPVVVTTAVQFFESLFANRTSRCRKLHNLAKSVIVLDEAQTFAFNVLSHVRLSACT